MERTQLKRGLAIYGRFNCEHFARYAHGVSEGADSCSNGHFLAAFLGRALICTDKSSQSRRTGRGGRHFGRKI